VRQLEQIREPGEGQLASDPVPRQLEPHHRAARLGLPKTYQESLDLLFQEGILPPEKAEDFARMVRFRNRAVHLYDRIDPREVWKILQEDLGDFELFIGAMVERFF
jgi:uncharacterized protein YutE (UPF0331/DUF86 family)